MAKIDLDYIAAVYLGRARNFYTIVKVCVLWRGITGWIRRCTGRPTKADIWREAVGGIPGQTAGAAASGSTASSLQNCTLYLLKSHRFQLFGLLHFYRCYLPPATTHPSMYTNFQSQYCSPESSKSKSNKNK